MYVLIHTQMQLFICDGNNSIRPRKYVFEYTFTYIYEIVIAVHILPELSQLRCSHLGSSFQSRFLALT